MKLFTIIFALIAFLIGFAFMGIWFIAVLIIGALTEPVWKKLF